MLCHSTLASTDNLLNRDSLASAQVAFFAGRLRLSLVNRMSGEEGGTGCDVDVELLSRPLDVSLRSKGVSLEKGAS